MPIYEFECMKCHEQFETLVFRADEKVSCPKCKGKRLERLMSCCGFKSSGSFTPSSGSSGCSGCTSSSCSTCN